MFAMFRLVCSLLLIAVLHLQGCITCEIKQPMEGYSPVFIEGTYYLVAENTGELHQKRDFDCPIATINSPQAETFKIFHESVFENGTIITTNLTAVNLSPPGHFKVTVDGTSQIADVSVLGGNMKYHVMYGCPGPDSDYGVSVYYYKRIQGIDSMDPDSLQQTKAILSKNNIPLTVPKDKDNKNCKN